MNKRTDLIIIAKNIFNSVDEKCFEGYICIEGNRISKIGKGIPDEIICIHAKRIIILKDEMIMPGIVDTHTFFTGNAIFHVGVDTSNISTSEQLNNVLVAYIKEKNPTGAILGHGWNPEILDQKTGEVLLEEKYGEKPIIIFAFDRGSCIMNRKAKEAYQFTSDTCYPESYHRIMPEYLNDREFIGKEFSDYMSMMNKKGVTTVKEMGFDDFYGFTDYLKELEIEDKLTLRTFFMSQPVGAPMNLKYAKKMRGMFTDEKIRFSGFNRMTDGTIASYKGELKEPYEGKDFICNFKIPWNEIESDVLAADREGFRWTLHAQGDGAAGHITDIYEKCQMENGRLKNAHGLTDMEFTHPYDLERLGKMGAVGEVYFQIMSLDSANVLLENIDKTIGKERGRRYWNRRKMEDAGITLCGATDLPLMITDVPSGIFYSSGGYLDGRDEPFQRENAISVAEQLKAWTIGGQKNLGMEGVLGTIEEGKIADFAVFDRNLLHTDLKTVRNAKVIMTIMDGKVVFEEK